MKIIIVKKHKRKIKLANKFLGQLRFGFYGIKSGIIKFLSKEQIELARIMLMRRTKRFGRIFVRVHFFIALTRKPVTSRMGKGTGSFKKWVGLIRRGHLLFEISNVSWIIVKSAFKALKRWFNLSLYLLKRNTLLE